jgi:tRNA pseudouridine32 synthase/23S rRNA pseudouridine746 synthase
MLSAMTVTYFDPQPRELPGHVPSPFATPPHPLARRAADELRAHVRGLGCPLDAPGAGKMFGVLVVVVGDGRVGYLRAFSGMLDGRWRVDGFVGPAFDTIARDAVWPAGEAELAAIDARLAELERESAPIRTRHAALVAGHDAETQALREAHAARRDARREARKGIDPAQLAALHALDQQSRGDGAERRRMLARHADECSPDASRLRIVEAERHGLEQLRSERSRVLLRQLHDTYGFANARGEHRALHELFAPESPPGGAGDCAAPKLFAHAYREGLRPLALAEVWLGAPPITGGRHAGTFYPACRGKCGPILAHVLEGLVVEPAPIFGAAAIAADEPRVVFEDDWLVIVDKPCGLLSVPGRSGALQDSVLTRLRRRHAGATGPLLVHRLDLDASGLMLAAKDERTHAALQEAFARRQIDKRYVAWLDGVVDGDGGVIELALRGDLDDRPRQIVDPVHGKLASTEWRVVERTATQTKVALWPRTGRTHQLRVHASHGLGLGAPIAGDRLYGRTGDGRLMLHAEALTFEHPARKTRLAVTAPAPF